MKNFITLLPDRKLGQRMKTFWELSKRRILSKIFGPVYEGEVWRRYRNNEFYELYKEPDMAKRNEMRDNEMRVEEDAIRIEYKNWKKTVR